MEMWGVATLILVAGMVDDLRSRKVHNGLVLSLFAVAILTSLYFRGISDSGLGLAAFAFALLLTIPMFRLGILGGGDVKLFAAFALCLDPTSVFWTLIYSMVWGAVFGLSRAAMQKQLMALVRNTYRLSGRHQVQRQELHKIPYTFALLLGWFTQLTFLHAGGAL